MPTSMILMLVALGCLVIGVGALVLGNRLKGQEINPDVCTEKTEGTVIGGSSFMYAGHRTARVSYEVNGQSYEIDGPMFEGGTTSPLTKSNLTTRDALPKTLKGPVVAGYRELETLAEVRYEDSVVAALYPVGSSATVWYNPNNPAMAYVERYVRANATGVLVTRILGASFILAAIFVVILGTVMGW